ncbi:MAG TPA: hypothetical protein ENN20_09735 [Candidatus Marinimicrobia bacterium]|nr:hypothetical protein [Candidatus Neomarinimicrobiota bacterium]
MLKIPIALAILLLIIVASGGEYADAFLENGVSARAQAMGNTLGALDFNLTSFISNPSGLSYIRAPQVGLMYTSQYGLANHNYAGFAMPVTRKSSASLNWIRYSVDDIPIRPDILRQVLDPEVRRDSVLALNLSPFDTFNDLEQAVYISFGHLISREVSLGWRYSRFTLEVPLGVNFKLIHKKLYNLEGYGLGIDLGGRMRFSGAEVFEITKMGQLSFGFTLRDVTGTIIYWNTKRQDEIRLNPVFSFGYEHIFMRHNILLNFGLEKEFRYEDKARYGLECIIKNRLSIRTGLINSGITAGLGLNFQAMNRIFHIDYSFLNHELGAVHRIGGMLEF